VGEKVRNKSQKEVKNLIKDVGGSIVDVADAVDDLYEDEQERQQVLSDRHTVDMQSDSWLSKNIRPITLLFAMVCQLIVVIGSLFVVIDAWLVGQVGTLMATVIGFYFSSRKAEKLAAKNATANIEIEKMKTKAQIKEARRQERHERREERRER
jgi:Na+/H+-translocating membrane pyrophosphatase